MSSYGYGRVVLAGLVAGLLSGVPLAPAREWVVDVVHPGAADTNVATREAPLRTISAAALQAEPGDRVLVRPGIYREAVAVPRSGRPDAPIVYESEVPYGAVVSGADPAPAEVWKPTEPGVWWTSWPGLKYNKYGNGEWVYANGAPLLRAETDGQLMPGMFRLDYTGSGVFVMPAEGQTPATLSLELARRDGLFHSGQWENSQKLKKDTAPITDIVIRGFRLMYNADWFRGYAALRISGERWLVESNRVEWGSHSGIQMSSSKDCIVRGNVVDWAGVQNIGGGMNVGLRFDNNLVRYGNFRRNDPGNEGGGSKFSMTLDSVFTGNRFEANYGSGLWFDGFNDANLIRGNRSTDNFGFGGFFSEIGWHDMYVENVSAYNGIGILVGESPGTVLRRNVICGNSAIGIRMRGDYRRAGMTADELDTTAARFRERLPGLSPERLEQWYNRSVQYMVVPKCFPLNNCAIYENLVFDNQIGYLEYRVYGDPAWPRAPFVQNFSDRNVFWTRDTNQVLFGGPANYVYTNGLAGWQQAAERDLASIVADPRVPSTNLPAWAADIPFLKERPLRLNTDLEQAGMKIVLSPETARLYARLRRATVVEPIALPVPALRACRFTLDGETCIAVWSTEERSRRYVSFKLNQPSVVVEDSYDQRDTRALKDGVLDLGVDYRPLFLRAVTGPVTVARGVTFDVRKFNEIGAAVPISVEAGRQATLQARLVPDGTASGTLFRVRLDGTLGGTAVCRVTQFAVGEGSGTIPYATRPIRVDGKTDDWGDLATRVPLAQIADMGKDGFGDAQRWTGPDDLSAKIHASWTEQGLYWLAVVRDDRPLGCPPGVMAYEGDAIELFFDGRSPEMLWQTVITDGTAQLGVTPALDGRASAYYRRPSTLPAETVTRAIPGGYVIEGLIPFDAQVFPAGEWKAGRAVKLALHVLDRDEAALLGQGYSKDFCALGWGITWVENKRGREPATFNNTSGWKTLILER
jgi:hypothetical protein